MQDDRQLLRGYVADGSEAAFGELVARYVNLVYSAALRRTGGDAHLAQEVAQLVFTDLARKARSLPANVVLAGWLHRATRYAAAQLLRAERRRAAREQEALTMNALAPEPTADWEQIRPLLDQALDELGSNDRDALILRFFEQRSLAEVGVALGSNEDAARKRVARALEKLRGIFTKRGVTLTGAAIAGAVSANAVQAVPLGLAAKISAAALLAGTTLTTTTAVVMTTLQKTIIGATLAVAAAGAIYEARQAATARAEVQALKQAQAPLAQQIQRLTRHRDEATNLVAGLQEEVERLNRNTAELLRLRGQMSSLRRELADTKRKMGLSDAQSSDLATRWVIGETKWNPHWEDLGLSSPDAAVQTYWCAIANTNAQRIKQCMCFDRVTNCILVSDIFAKREARANQGWYQGRWAARLAAVTQGSPCRAQLQIDWMAVGRPDRLPFDPANPPKWITDRTETVEVMRNGAEEDWKVVGDEHRIMLTLDDEDSEAVAKMLIQMPPEQLEQVKSLIPDRTLRVFKELKAKSVK